MAVRLTPANAVGVFPDNEVQAGTLVGPKQLPTLIRCLEDGVKFVADVANVTESEGWTRASSSEVYMSGAGPDITVVGGYYGERCVSPEVDVCFGSGGRAAFALAAADRSVRWRYYCPQAEQRNATCIVAHENLEHMPAASDALVSFRYTHPLARPEYLPFPLPKAEPLTVEDEAVLRFGLMEGTGVVKAEACVYDPQGDPQDFGKNGSSASKLAIVLNVSEALALGQAVDEAGAVQSLFAGGNLSALAYKGRS